MSLLNLSLSGKIKCDCSHGIENAVLGLFTEMSKHFLIVFSRIRITLKKAKAVFLTLTLHFSFKATTSCKNVATLQQTNDVSYFKSLLVTGL